MHEVAIMEDILTLAADEAAKQGASRILTLRVRIGTLSGVDPEALRFAFEAVSPGTAVDGAELLLEEVPVACQCDHCGREFAPPDLFYECPGCGRLSACVARGRELELASLEVD